MGAKVDYQVATPTELGTPTMHRAKIAQPRVRMEGWRQRRPGSNARNSQEEQGETHLTHTGLLMEGVENTRRPRQAKRLALPAGIPSDTAPGYEQ